jgi:hypothetical protein
VDIKGMDKFVIAVSKKNPIACGEKDSVKPGKKVLDTIQ